MVLVTKPAEHVYLSVVQKIWDFVCLLWQNCSNSVFLIALAFDLTLED